MKCIKNYYLKYLILIIKEELIYSKLEKIFINLKQNKNLKWNLTFKIAKYWVREVSEMC